jgi:uncharacterized membrane protein
MTKISLLLKSKTFYTLVLMLAFNLFSVYGSKLSPELNTLVNVVLTALAGYFKVTPSQNYQA